MEPKCGFCQSTDFTVVTRKRNGANLLLIICDKCGAILAAVEARK